MLGSDNFGDRVDAAMDGTNVGRWVGYPGEFCFRDESAVDG